MKCISCFLFLVLNHTNAILFSLLVLLQFFPFLSLIALISMCRRIVDEFRELRHIKKKIKQKRKCQSPYERSRTSGAYVFVSQKNEKKKKLIRKMHRFNNIVNSMWHCSIFTFSLHFATSSKSH